MIEKLKKPKSISWDDDADSCIQRHKIIADTIDKVNEIVEAVNTIQKEREAERFEIQEWIDIIEAVRKSVNIHEKQIDELQMKLEPEKCKTPAVPFAEQRKWIGKLCRFWNDDESLEDSMYGELINIFDTPHEYCPFQCGFGEWYEHCEPVKPDDDVIYKGE